MVSARALISYNGTRYANNTVRAPLIIFHTRLFSKFWRKMSSVTYWWEQVLEECTRVLRNFVACREMGGKWQYFKVIDFGVFLSWKR